MVGLVMVGLTPDSINFSSCASRKERRKKEEGGRKKEEGRRKKEEGRRKKEEGRKVTKMSCDKRERERERTTQYTHLFYQHPFDDLLWHSLMSLPAVFLMLVAHLAWHENVELLDHLGELRILV
jgi:hypothetical protein